MSKHLFAKGCSNPNWNGGRRHSQGYVYVLQPGHPNADKHGYVREHVLLMSNLIGRPIKKHEVVHHANEIRSDNRIENLILMTRRRHTSHHAKGNVKDASKANLRCTTSDEMKQIWNTTRAHEKRKPIMCAGCGREFISRQSSPKYCTHDCYLKHKHPGSRTHKVCDQCGAEYKTRGRRRRFCSRKCYLAHAAAS